NARRLPVERWVNLEIAMEPESDNCEQREQRHCRQEYFGCARHESEERNEHQRHCCQRQRKPWMNETETHPVRLLTHVAVPDHEILAERDVSPERSECETQLSEIVEMLFHDQVIAVEIFSPRHRENREARQRCDPAAHE